MKGLWMFLLCSALLAPRGPVVASGGPTRVYECLRVAQPPLVDGKLTDLCWQQATRTTQFVRVLRGPEKIQPTIVQAVHDGAFLYVAVTCLEPNPLGIRATVTTNDLSTIMADDAVEIFVRPDLEAPDYYQFAANSLGARYEGKAFDSSWNAEWQAAASVGTSAWYLECAIPLSALGHLPTPGAVWGFNVARDRQAGGETEWSSWADTPEGFHMPDRFGRLIFSGQGGGIDRGLLLECARYAQSTIALENALHEALAAIREGMPALSEKQRQQAQPKIAAAEESLKALAELLRQPSPLDLERWVSVAARMEKAARQLEDVVWEARFARLISEE